ncbi:MAG TPA: hypothetical protein DCM10_17435 [Xanthomarina gelatinilytica]|nr:hypothetical protein [Xanthomarina gelatinilytica]|tara:strand:+ start:312 stop:605 length:294 start_codon:yes stop_codon:yes gene_type:complete
MKNFKDIEFKPDIIGGVRGKLEIENGIMISVVAGKFNYCTPRENSPIDGWSSFEVAVLDSYGSFITKRIVDDAGGDVLGWQSREDINNLIKQIYNYE